MEVAIKARDLGFRLISFVSGCKRIEQKSTKLLILVGMVLVKLASSTGLHAAVILHLGPITEDQINDVKVPIAILGAGNVHIFLSEQLKQFGEKLLAKSEIDSFVKIFPSMAHGWMVKSKADDESTVKSAEASHLDMLNWFTKYVK
ncbi:hypothetical protein SO802_006059 [Lithocarpus litseifolius]|uniref:Dienelactone hydrolase domain-containing protein n=1 Tax=Lithocarpus litseifolius TaxID=425828 RepID=A0AAW2DPL2_9ROSI